MKGFGCGRVELGSGACSKYAYIPYRPYNDQLSILTFQCKVQTWARSFGLRVG